MYEYPTLTALMAGREHGSVKVRVANPHVLLSDADIFRVGRLNPDGTRAALDNRGFSTCVYDVGPWVIVPEDAPALDTLRLEIAARVLAGLFSTQTNSLPCALHEDHGGSWDNRHAYALAEADALIKEARKC